MIRNLKCVLVRWELSMRSCRNKQCRIRSYLSYFVLPFVHDVGDCHNHKRHLIIHISLIRSWSYQSLAFFLFGLFEISLKLTINHIMALLKWPKMIIFVFFGNAVSSLTISHFFYITVFYDLNPLKLIPLTVLPFYSLCLIWYHTWLKLFHSSISFLEELYHCTFSVFRPKTVQKSSFLIF